MKKTVKNISLLLASGVFLIACKTTSKVNSTNTSTEVKTTEKAKTEQSITIEQRETLISVPPEKIRQLKKIELENLQKIDVTQQKATQPKATEQKISRKK